MNQMGLLILAALLNNGAIQAQNLGVGATTPETRLHVVDSMNDVQLRV